MQVTGIHHHSVIVTDLDRSRAFYGGVLGLPEVPIPPTFGDAAIAWYEVGGQQIHLLRSAIPEVPSGRHIALHVADTAAARRQLRALGHRVEETTEIPGADRFFTADPDGNRIELIHWRRPWSETHTALGLTVARRLPAGAPGG